MVAQNLPGNKGQDRSDRGETTISTQPAESMSLGGFEELNPDSRHASLRAQLLPKGTPTDSVPSSHADAEPSCYNPSIPLPVSVPEDSDRHFLSLDPRPPQGLDDLAGGFLRHIDQGESLLHFDGPD